jgi:hypothetical protein
MKLHPFEGTKAGQPVVRFTSNNSRAEVDQFVADAGLTPDWSRLSGPTASKINGKAFQLWELPAAKTDNGR